MVVNICQYFLAFIIYSIIGWCIEVILTLIKEHKFIDRGFLLGPYCPIYGWGSIFIILLLKNYTSNFLVVFVLATVICMVLEYITSFLMEKLFKARWWDYSQMKFNINGRICLETAIPFGLGALLIIYIVNPFIFNTIELISNKYIVLVSSIVFILFLTDNIISFNIISKFKDAQMKLRMDNTEEITARIRSYLMEHSKFTKRLSNAFPNMISTLEDIKEKGMKELEQTKALFLKNKK